MKGIILAGGLGKRLYPITAVMCKQLLPVYDKPMIYYPLSTLMLAGIREILVISTPNDIEHFNKLLNDGSDLGISIKYAIQNEPRGLADAFIIGKSFIDSDNVCLILGDNIFYGNDFGMILQKAASLKEGALIFGYYVQNPSAYGVVELSPTMEVLSIEEKPIRPKSNYVVSGLYFYDNTVISIAEKVKPSERGEIEITDINTEYLKIKKLKIELLGRGFAWFDTGTHDSLADAAFFVKAIEDRQGLKIACIEEIAYRMGFIDREKLLTLSKKYQSSKYGEYLRNI